MIPNRVFELFEPIPHPLLTVAMAVLMAAIVALLGKRTRRERVLHAVWFAGCSIAAVIVGSWMMYFVHG